MQRLDWEERYVHGDKPWDTGEVDPHLRALIEGGTIAPGRALEVGCGSGTNAIWLAERGFEVLGLDLSPTALATATARAAGIAGIRFQPFDFLAETLAEGPFDFAFDRGCFHVFDDAGDRVEFARRVAAALRPGASWLSVLGSTEGPPRDHGPPRRSALDVVTAIEPVLEIVELVTCEFVADIPSPARAWRCLSRRRTTPAQPSTRR